MVKWIHDFVDQCIEILGAGSAITAIANLALKFFDFLFPAADFVTLILSIAGAIFDIGYTALTAAFTTTEYDLLLCIFYCNVDASGQVSATKLAHIESQITSQLNTTAALVVNAILFIQGEVGLSNAGVFEALTGQDCSACACEWCYTFDFTASDGGWHVLTGAPGTYSAGVGWIGTYVSPTNISSLRIAIDFTTTVISQYEVTYSVAGPGSMEGTGFLRLRDSGATVFSGDVDGNPGTYTHHFDTSGNADAAWAGSDSASDQTITRITLHGLGTNPFGDDNC
jgi:hypothetical protein